MPQDCKKGILIIESQKINEPPFISLINLNNKSQLSSLFCPKPKSITAHPIISSRVPELVSSLKQAKPFSFSLSHTPNAPSVFGYLPESFTFADEQSPPWLLHLHGGPFVGATDRFSNISSLVLANGVGFMSINYRGSFGYGWDYQNSLVGNCGRMDVDDCVEAILRSEEVGLDPSNVFLYGGSHGGYLISKLVEDERLSGKIRASIALNSVIYMNMMIYNSDIPEWAWASFKGTEYKYKDTVLFPLVWVIGRLLRKMPWTF